MNVFVRCWPDSRLRAGLATSVVARVLEESPVTMLCSYEMWNPSYSPFSVSWLSPSAAADCLKHVWLDGEDFHRTSKAKAAQLATTDWLLILDDDQLPLYRDWVGYAVSLTKRFPDYSAIAGWSVTHEVPRPESLIAESDSIGCPMIVRRSALLDATAEPIENTARADTILTGRLQRHGKTGIARNWRYNHLGMGYSQVIPAHWMPECPA